jgi:hypothetical protein
MQIVAYKWGCFLLTIICLSGWLITGDVWGLIFGVSALIGLLFKLLLDHGRLE